MVCIGEIVGDWSTSLELAYARFWLAGVGESNKAAYQRVAYTGVGTDLFDEGAYFEGSAARRTDYFVSGPRCQGAGLSTDLPTNPSKANHNPVANSSVMNRVCDTN